MGAPCLAVQTHACATNPTRGFSSSSKPIDDTLILLLAFELVSTSASTSIPRFADPPRPRLRVGASSEPLRDSSPSASPSASPSPEPLALAPWEADDSGLPLFCWYSRAACCAAWAAAAACPRLPRPELSLT